MRSETAAAAKAEAAAMRAALEQQQAQLQEAQRGLAARQVLQFWSFKGAPASDAQ